MNSAMDPINAATQWFNKSGIQIDEERQDTTGKNMHGGIHAWFNLETKEHSYIYSEITGYALTTLAYMHDALGEHTFTKDRIRAAADWLVRTQDPTGAAHTAFYTTQEPAQTKRRGFHMFDSGMVYNGLAHAYRTTGEQTYLDAAERSAKWCIAQQRPDGSFPARIDVATGEIIDTDETWSTQPGAFHGKLAIGFLNLFDITKDDIYLRATEKLLEATLAYQQPDGRFLTYGEKDGTHLHPHSYAVEGLYVAAAVLENDTYLDAARRGIQWSVDQIQDGIAPRFVHSGTPTLAERVDILAQTYRLAQLLDVDAPSLHDLREKLLSYQYEGDVESQNGGFLFGKMSDGTTARHVNSWVTMFALQAISLPTDEKMSPYLLV